VKLRGVFVRAVSGWLCVAWACGSRSSVWLFDEVGNDGGGRNTTLDSSGDVSAADVAGEAPSGREPGDARVTDAVANSAGDAVEADVVTDVPSCPEWGDSGTQPLSCSVGGPGMTHCGASEESCCTSLEVCGGTYYRAYTNAGSGPTGEADPASVTRFRLDKYLVTVGRFRQFVTAWNGGSGYTPPAGSGKHTHLNNGLGLANTVIPGGYESGWITSDDENIEPTSSNLACPPYDDPSSPTTWTATVAGNENQPINCVNWYEAYAFCIWDGGFLPSEAEWEYAAAGGSQQREYPWGSTDPGNGYQYANYDNYYFDSSNSYIAPVGAATLGAGRWQQLDLAGEVNEWTMDFFDYYVVPCIDCASLTPTSPGPQLAPFGRIARGGYFGAGATFLTPYARDFSGVSTARASDFGLRCARAP
jgi:sulfatase modifying factor 1